MSVRARSLLIASLLAAACSRKSEPAPAGDAAQASSAPASSAWPVFDSLSTASDAGARPLVSAHFGDAAPATIETTTVELTSPGRRATLMKVTGKPTSEAKPLVYVSEDAGQRVLWSRDRPVAGIMAPVGPIAIAAGPSDRVALAACDPPTGVIALRIWDADGAPFADFQAMSNETCEAISLGYWRRRGWVIAIARTGATRAQLVKENGSMAWSGGLDIGVRSREGALAPPVLAFDTDDTFLLTQIAQPSGEKGSPFHAMVFRYDAEGTAIWPQAVSIPLKNGGPRQQATMKKRHDGVSIEAAERAVVIRPSGAYEPL